MGPAWITRVICIVLATLGIQGCGPSRQSIRSESPETVIHQLASCLTEEGDLSSVCLSVLPVEVNLLTNPKPQFTLTVTFNSKSAKQISSTPSVLIGGIPCEIQGKVQKESETIQTLSCIPATTLPVGTFDLTLVSSEDGLKVVQKGSIRTVAISPDDTTVPTPSTPVNNEIYYSAVFAAPLSEDRVFGVAAPLSVYVPPSSSGAPAITKVQFFIDGQPIASTTQMSTRLANYYEAAFNSTTYSNGMYLLSATVTGSKGTERLTAIAIQIQNNVLSTGSLVGGSLTDLSQIKFTTDSPELDNPPSSWTFANSVLMPINQDGFTIGQASYDNAITSLTPLWKWAYGVSPTVAFQNLTGLKIGGISSGDASQYVTASCSVYGRNYRIAGVYGTFLNHSQIMNQIGFYCNSLGDQSYSLQLPGASNGLQNYYKKGTLYPSTGFDTKCPLNTYVVKVRVGTIPYHYNNTVYQAPANIQLFCQ